MKTSSSRTATRTTRKVAGTLKKYDLCRFAVVLPQCGGEPLRGTARYERDDLLGNVLRIAVEGDCPGNPEILLAEREWNGLIIEGSRYACDYCVTLVPETKEKK